MADGPTTTNFAGFLFTPHSVVAHTENGVHT